MPLGVSAGPQACLTWKTASMAGGLLGRQLERILRMTIIDQKVTDATHLELRNALRAQRTDRGTSFLPVAQGEEHIYRSSFKCHWEDPEAGSFDRTGRWSIHEMIYNSVRLSKYADGHFRCIPKWDVGCALSDSLTEIRWNFGKIKPCVAMSVAEGLADFSRMTCQGR